MNPNEAMVEKTITTGNISTTNGGQLTPAQQSRFVTLVRRHATLLPLVRFIRMSRPSMDIDKLHIGEPLTQGASENTTTSDSYAPKFNKVTLTAVKVRTDWALTTELLQGNIEQDQFEATLMRGITERMAHDLELMAVQGDDTLTGTTPLQKLRKVLDGWDKLTDSAHIIDVDGGNISKAVFSAMLRQVPKEFKGDPGMRWFIGSDIATDWLDTLADRATGVGDDALRGQGIAPYGKPLVEVPMIPDDKVMTGLNVQTSAYLLGEEFGPFEFDDSANLDRLSINVDGAGAVVVTFITSASLHTTLGATEVAEAINTAYVAAHGASYANVARVTSDGRVLLVSPTVGTSSAIVVADPDSPTSTVDLLGFTANSDAGLAAGSGEAADGSFLWLLNPQNLIWALLDGTRIYTEFNRQADRIEATIFNQVAAQVENLSAIVKAVNVRKKAAM